MKQVRISYIDGTSEVIERDRVYIPREENWIVVFDKPRLFLVSKQERIISVSSIKEIVYLEEKK